MVVRASVALALVVVLAGCSDPATTADGLSALDIDDVEVETTSALGGIRGIVVDEAIRPIAGANLSVVGSGLTATTDAGGVFTFDNLEPGAYFIAVAAPRFIGTQASAEVSAGQITDVRVLLSLDPTPAPFVETIQYDGFIEASAPLASYIIDIVVTSFTNSSVCDCWWVFASSGNVTTVVFEYVWEPSTPLGSDMYYQFYEHACDEQHIHSEFVESPFLAHIERSFWQVEGCDQLAIHFGGSATGVNVNQAFRAFISQWSNGIPPEGWSVAGGGG